MKSFMGNRAATLLALLGISVFGCGLGKSACAQDLPKIRKDVVYGHKDGMALTMDVFEPEANRKGIGLMFMVSGGWVSTWMPPAQMSNFFKPLLDEGYTIIAVRHGSSPKYVIPEIVEDVRKALETVNKQSEEWKIDKSKIGVFGFSAGGHLSLMLGTTANDKKRGPKIAAVAAVFPPTDLAPYKTPGNPRMEQFPALKFDSNRDDEFSPLRQVTSVDAPTLLVHGDKDDLVPISHSENIKEAFEKSSVPCELVVIKGAAHGFNDDGNRVMFESMRDWFKKHLDNRQPNPSGE
ncbi:MAG: alpha/beta hydrolase family protein [Pirellula sp.]